MEKRTAILMFVLFFSLLSFELILSNDHSFTGINDKSIKKSLTESFLMDGVMQFNVTGYTDVNVNGIKSDSQGNLIIGASLYNGSYYDIGVIRFQADGSPDLTFGGGDGVYIYPDQGYNEYVGSFDVDSEGNIFIGGHYYSTTSTDDRHSLLLKINSSGMLEEAIEPLGYNFPLIGSGCTVSDNGNVYFASWGRQTRSIYDPRVHCFQADTLELNTTFNSDGIADWTGTWAWTTYSYGPFLDSDGNLYIWGYDYQGNNDDSSAFILRYLEDGSLDTTFGGDGDDVSPGVWEYPATKFDIAGSQSTRAYNLYADTIHNYIYVRVRNYTGNIFTMRLYYNGVIDSSFANNGVWDPVINGVDGTEIVKGIDTDGNIIFTGNIGNNATLLKLDESGDALSEFGNNGIFWYNSSEGSSFGDILLLPDNSMIVVGKIGTNGVILHIDSLGNLVVEEETTDTTSSTSETTSMTDTTETTSMTSTGSTTEPTTPKTESSTSFEFSLSFIFAIILLYSFRQKRR